MKDQIRALHRSSKLVRAPPPPSDRPPSTAPACASCSASACWQLGSAEQGSTCGGGGSRKVTSCPVTERRGRASEAAIDVAAAIRTLEQVEENGGQSAGSMQPNREE